ncbi:protein IMPAIRED IN BABA-INDUCED STERILITY 1-like [Phragmites australis]|uniref:protein IMPAIRED IN BABA-INDUCED STERILITY 1-like n=1 Tax=Phragmites australis TaxID=29695 RepID=UPI002D788C68|nr:protein IMPAIRED IN BABA-INDUCED STERILITY 1-like [Phragmites australis]
MGCVASKNTVSVTPAADSSGALRDRGQPRAPERAAMPLPAPTVSVSVPSLRSSSSTARRSEKVKDEAEEPGKAVVAVAAASRSFRLRSLRKSLEGEQVAAGWPPWLSAVAGEAIQGWIPLKVDSFEKLEKVGQGTYSSVFRARDLDTGKIVALKKVRFDNFEPESVRFMAREIQILRRLDHPNVMKLEGLITSRLSCSLYLVFEYMEHDLAGLCSSPDIKFSEAQLKCYMNQLLSGLEHCHSHRVVHRDIKGANLLVNNEGVLKIADFGLANYFDPSKNHPLTSRVVTLWYRPPELLLGSTHYDAAVDLWSVGCVFAEMFRGKPILQGRTEVEQLHKIFKLCGSPADDYWKKSKLPHATIFKPHHPYPSTLRDVFKEVPENALSLLETLLSVEPYKRGTASGALTSEFFKTKPYACEPSSLPKYAPNKEMDAKIREDLLRRKASSRGHGPEASKKSSRLSRAAREPSAITKQTNNTEESKTNVNETKDGAIQDRTKVNGDARLFADIQPVSAAHVKERAGHVKNDSREEIPSSGPLIVSSSSGFAWAKKPQEDRSFARSRSRSSSRCQFTAEVDQDNKSQAKENVGLRELPNRDVHIARSNSKVREPHDVAKRAVLKKWSQLERPDSFDSCDTYHSQNFSNAIYLGDTLSSKNSFKDNHDQGEKVEYSGPLLSQSHKVDELLERHERHIRQVVRKSWFGRGRKQDK